MKSIQISDELYDEVAKLADADNLPVDLVVTALVSERITNLNRLEARAARGLLDKFNQVLAKIPAVEPDAWDLL